MPQMINDSPAAIIKDSATAAIESHAITPNGVEIFGLIACSTFSCATAVRLTVIGVIEFPFPCFPTKSAPAQDCLSCYDLRIPLPARVKDLTIAPGRQDCNTPASFYLIEKKPKRGG